MIALDTAGLAAGQRALVDACPFVCVAPGTSHVPLREPGRRWVMAADGLYLEARSLAVHVMHRVGTIASAYGDAKAFQRTINGRVPSALLDQCIALAVAAGDKEIAALIHWNPVAGTYELSTPDIISAGAAHVTYRDEAQDELLVCDFHSHGHLPGFFSSTDDASDLSRVGPYFALVAGRCQSRLTLEVCSRMCVSPYLVNCDQAQTSSEATVA
ncbi:PRTRC system protein A (plasmid) [Xanthomonas citri pv. citri]|uniref:PRTRC system protein A n=1 Tax=Xanthomonas citri TaxID=346 RepID=UPI0019327071|nr:PRTRC system protein A [Xanthomonas citri]QRD62728.1 PRTRC system protein A [Xanthomonas citri pv. citri]QRD67055.1 PRTRC system protein A [Xanthomonas citri pv. citri]QRD71692.1 PRTRC system protein A [Xanthomonas citri pv. citri]